MRLKGMAVLLLIGSTAGAQGGHTGHEAPRPPPPPPAASHEGHNAPGPPPAATSGHQGAAPEAPGGVPEGYAVVQVAPERQQLIGLKVAKAERGRLSGTVRASAIIQADETKEAHVHSKLMGWVQELFVNAVGQQVKKGQPLYSLYSQELYATQQEYRRARATSPELASAARARLKLWDVPDDQVKRIEREGPQKAITFRSPIDGTVIEKQVLPGHYVDPEMLLYRIADLSRVWVSADVYEFEVNRLDKKGTARVEVQGVTEPIQALVDYVYPTVDPVSRTVKVRLVVPNPRGSAAPGELRHRGVAHHAHRGALGARGGGGGHRHAAGRLRVARGGPLPAHVGEGGAARRGQGGGSRGALRGSLRRRQRPVPHR